MRPYAIKSPYWTVNDSPSDLGMKRLAFHVAQGDALPYLATIAGFLAEPSSREAQAALSADLRSALMYLHERYELVPRRTPIAYTREKHFRFDAKGPVGSA